MKTITPKCENRECLACCEDCDSVPTQSHQKKLYEIERDLARCITVSACHLALFTGCPPKHKCLNKEGCVHGQELDNENYRKKRDCWEKFLEG